MDIADESVVTPGVTRARQTGPPTRTQFTVPQVDQLDLDTRPGHSGGTITAGIPAAMFNRPRDGTPPGAPKNWPEPLG